MTNLSVATASNPTNLPARYEIRKLTEEHVPWVTAIVMHSNIFHSPVWSKTYPDDKAARLYACFDKADWFMRHQVKSGHSFGVFDLDYKFKREESKATHGKLYWDSKNTSLGTDELVEQMDFPLVSVALSYDQTNPLVDEELGPLIALLPLFGTAYHILEELDPRDSAWKATAPGQVLMRNATSTRRDAEGLGLMKRLAQFLMRYAAEQGFRGIQIEAFQDRVEKVWMEPPPPFKGNQISFFNTWEYTEDQEVDGKVQKVYVYGDGRQKITKIYVDLRP